MPADIVRAQYDELDTIAKRFQQQAEVQTQLRTRIERSVRALQQGGWQGEGAGAFFAEMSERILPALHRLVDGLTQAHKTTLDVKQILQTAEQEAAEPFRGQQASTTANGQGSDGGLWSRIGGWVHGGLDVLGLIPVYGAIPNGANALIYLAEGRKLEAAISAVAMIPIEGDIAILGKWGVKAGAEVLEHGAVDVVKEGAELFGERLAKEGAETLAEQGAKHADEFLRFGELAPNTNYIRNGYEYTTDALGRTQQVTGELVLESAPRTIHQTEVGRLGLSTDQGGHLIGARFGGTPEGVNLVPQNMNLNNSAWKTMENEWERALKQEKNVQIEIKLRYPSDDSMRPGLFEVKYNIDGQSYTKIFRNKPGG